MPEVAMLYTVGRQQPLSTLLGHISSISTHDLHNLWCTEIAVRTLLSLFLVSAQSAYNKVACPWPIMSCINNADSMSTFVQPTLFRNPWIVNLDFKTMLSTLSSWLPWFCNSFRKHLHKHHKIVREGRWTKSKEIWDQFFRNKSK